MRYFVYFEPEHAPGRPYILAEVVRETNDDGRFREWSAAASLAGDQCRIMTRDELLKTTNGARALRAWETLDDRQFDIDTQRIVETMEREESATGSSGRHLRAVPDEPEWPAGFTSPNHRVQWLAARRRTLLVEALRLREQARSVIESANARRAETARAKDKKVDRRGSG